MVRTVAVLGANGFIGAQTVAQLCLSGGFEVKALVRAASRADNIRDQCELRVVNAESAVSLYRGFRGVDLVVHAITGDPGLIVESAATALEAAVEAGVRRIVYLSSAAVHTQAPAPGTTEETPVRADHVFHYNNAKVRAEQRIRWHRLRRRIEVVTLRPQVVYGPRAYWVRTIRRELCQGVAYLGQHGRGVCDAVAVENLVHAITLALDAFGVDGEAFFVGDAEQVTWRDFYAPLAADLGVSLDALPDVPAPALKRSFKQRWVEPLRSSPLLHEALDRGPKALRRYTDRVLGRRRAAAPPPVLDAPSSRRSPAAFAPDPMLSAMHHCRTKLPIAKAERMLGYRPVVAFAEAMGALRGPLLQGEQSHAER